MDGLYMDGWVIYGWMDYIWMDGWIKAGYCATRLSGYRAMQIEGFMDEFILVRGKGYLIAVKVELSMEGNTHELM